MKRFLDLLRAPEPSSADLSKAIAENDVEAAQAEHARLRSQRDELLMEGDDKTLDALEARISAAGRQVERTRIVRDQLTASLAEAEAREADEALTAERAAVEAEATAVAKALRTVYPKLATELVALLRRLEAAEDAVQAVNGKLHKAARSDDVLAEVETRAFPVAAHQWAPNYSILGRTTLAEKPGLCPGYNDRPDTGGMVIQSPTGPALNPNNVMAGPSRTFGGFVDTGASA